MSKFAIAIADSFFGTNKIEIIEAVDALSAMQIFADGKGFEYDFEDSIDDIKVEFCDCFVSDPMLIG